MNHYKHKLEKLYGSCYPTGVINPTVVKIQRNEQGTILEVFIRGTICEIHHVVTSMSNEGTRRHKEFNDRATDGGLRIMINTLTNKYWQRCLKPSCSNIDKKSQYDLDAICDKLNAKYGAGGRRRYFVGRGKWRKLPSLIAVELTKSIDDLLEEAWACEDNLQEGAMTGGDNPSSPIAHKPHRKRQRTL